MRKVAVFCGSSTGNDPKYAENAIQLADYFVANDITMINGGGSIGMMGIMADRMIDLGGKCIGVIPIDLKERELAHYGMTELITTTSMHERKRIIIEMCDALIALPGGYGTLDELFESITWRQLEIHKKPVGIFNVDGYFDPIIEMADKMNKAGFVNDSSRKILVHDHSIKGLFEKLDAAVPMNKSKWE